jgi:predicted ATPase
MVVETIMAEDITNNVLHLLSSKMNGLSDDVQTLLKAMACFGTSVDEFVIGYLSEVPDYAGVGEGLTKALDEGYVERDRHGNVKFVHDKVREASYDLILEEEKTKVSQ